MTARRWARLRSLWRNLVHRDRIECHLDEELRAAADLLVQARRASRIDPMVALLQE